jgi:hypothetical protein
MALKTKKMLSCTTPALRVKDENASLTRSSMASMLPIFKPFFMLFSTRPSGLTVVHV